MTNPQVGLEPVLILDYDEFFDMLRTYMAEMDAFDPEAEEIPYDVDLYIDAMLETMDGREFYWIIESGKRVGMAIIRYLPDFPDEMRMVATISEFYVLPEHRRRGIATAAVEAILEDHRGRDTYEVEAGILRDNAPARAFWERMGFGLRSYVTARRP